MGEAGGVVGVSWLVGYGLLLGGYIGKGGFIGGSGIGWMEEKKKGSLCFGEGGKSWGG